MKKFIWFAIVLLAVPFQTASQDVTRVERADAAFRDWAQAAGVKHAAIAVGYEGAVVYTAGIGQRADEPADIASLSKAITAMCLADVLAENGLTFKTRLSDVFDNVANAQSADLTLGQLVSQASGLDEDETQDHMWRWVNEAKDRHQDAAELALARGPNMAQLGQFNYNNENYAVLGWLISALTGAPYIEACKARIFGEGSIGASDRWGAFAAWGGWKVSAEDYLSFVHRYFGSGSAMAQNPEGLPNVYLGQSRYYGMGSFWRQSHGGGYNFWHFGLLCFSGDGNSAGAYFASYGGKWSVSVNFSGCITGDQQRALDTLLWRAFNE
ncbi:MAG: beta-lactamase family protein [Rhodobacteraceae bacterium]|nr:beta-lactamase family protein [Paracoccaceae bacterium]